MFDVGLCSSLRLLCLLAIFSLAVCTTHLTHWGCPNDFARACTSTPFVSSNECCGTNVGVGSAYNGHPPDACPGKAIIAEYRPSVEEHAVQCCSTAGSQCERVALIGTWAEAAQACADKEGSWRLCAPDEMHHCCNEGNAFDWQRVWACEGGNTCQPNFAGCEEGQAWDMNSGTCTPAKLTDRSCPTDDVGTRVAEFRPQVETHDVLCCKDDGTFVAGGTPGDWAHAVSECQKDNMRLCTSADIQTRTSGCTEDKRVWVCDRLHCECGEGKVRNSDGDCVEGSLYMTFWGCPGDSAPSCASVAYDGDTNNECCGTNVRGPDLQGSGHPPDACEGSSILPELRMPTEEHAVQCCSHDGASCERRPVVGGRQEAVVACASVGKRLCTLSELHTGICCNLGHAFDFQRVWACENDMSDCDDLGCAEGQVWDNTLRRCTHGYATGWSCPDKSAPDCVDDKTAGTVPDGFRPDACDDSILIAGIRSPAEVHAVHCCQDSPSQCERLTIMTTWDEAVAACAAKSKRLCTQAELQDKRCCSLGNAVDYQRSWACENDKDYCSGCMNGEEWDDALQMCAAPCSDTKEGYYCLADGSVRPCQAGYYCEGGRAAETACICDEGFYCPAVFTPNADFAAASASQASRRAYPGDPLKGRRCPPNKYCAGDTEQPVDLPAVCDLVQACGPILEQNATCWANQSTYYSLNNPPADYATDQDTQTCMKTADAKQDDNAQWARIDLGSPRVVGTVRFVSDADGNDTDFTVIANMRDASEPDDLPDPSAGGIIPTPYDSCAVSGPVEGVYEAACPPGTIAQFVFILRASAKEVLEVCDVEVFGHECLQSATEAPTCPEGTEPSACTGEDAYCRGCSSCPPGSYSDKTSDDKCTPCPGIAPYGEVPYSPEGATSVFQCESAQYLESSSTMGITAVKFNQALDAWTIDVDFLISHKAQVNGVAALYISTGGSNIAATEDTFQASNFPCKATGSGNEATMCCLQSFREEYATTKLFRDFTDGLDLVAANDQCDGPQGSNMLLNADLDVVGESGTVFVDAEGEPFANPITVELTNTSMADSYYKGTYSARITIPDAELYKISRGSDDGNLTDTRELFIGLLDMLPTGTSVVDSSSQQISVLLTRTQYGTFAAYGAQNIDYDFISYLNARTHRVLNQGGLAPAQLAFLDTQWEDYVEWHKCWVNQGPYDRIFGDGATCEEGDSNCAACTSHPPLYDGWESSYASGNGYEEFVEEATTTHFAEISFVWDGRLMPFEEDSPVELDTVRITPHPSSRTADYWSQWSVTQINPCSQDASNGVFSQSHQATNTGFNTQFLPLVNQQCVPDLDWPSTAFASATVTLGDVSENLAGINQDTQIVFFNNVPWQPAVPVVDGFCPQFVRPSDNFGRIYLPLPGGGGPTMDISFNLKLKDGTDNDSKSASLRVDVVLFVADAVTHCDATGASVDLADRVIPALQIGSEATAPPRLERIGGSATPTDFGTGVETLQDGLITLELALNTTAGLDDNLEVFLEDVLVIHVNPGSPVSADDLRTETQYKPSYTYTPSSRDAQLNIPGPLEGACRPSDGAAPSTSFFGCVYKHVLADNEVQDEEWAYLVGSGDAQAFMETMLGSGTARASARALGRAYENALLADGFGTRTKVGLWINPGHKWGQTVQNSDYSLSEHVIIYALYGVNAGVDGTTRRMLLQASGDGGRQELVQSVSYNVKAEDLVEKLLPNTVASSWTVTMAVDPREACLEPSILREIFGQRFQEKLSPYASKVRDVQVLSLTVLNAECGDARRAGSSPLLVVEVVVALEDVPGAFLDFEALVQADDGVLAMRQIEDGAELGLGKAPSEATEAGSDESGSNLVLMVGAAVGGAVVVLAGCAAYKARRVVCCHGEQLTEVVSASVPVDTPTEKPNIENILMFHQEAAPTRPATQRAPMEQEVTMEDLFVRASTARRVSDTL